MNKASLLAELIAQLSAQIEGFERSARATHAEATHEQSKAENKYDTRALEASYLAEGQTRHALEVAQALQSLTSFEPRAFAPSDPIDLGALVELHAKEGTLWYFLLPCAGGTQLHNQHGETPVTVLTPQAPLAQHLLAKTAGTSFLLSTGRSKERSRLRIHSVR